MVALDSAIASTAMEKYGSLRLSHSDQVELAKSIQMALEALRDLQIGALPNYRDDWIALLYLLWFQPKQINLAYSLISETLLRVPNINPFLKSGAELNVVDFGCGSLAMQFAVCLVVADAIEEHGLSPTVNMYSIDSSTAMVQMGNAVWDEFKKLTAKDPGLVNVRRASESLVPRTHHAIPGAVVGLRGKNNWLSALHAVYEDNKVPLAKSLQYLKENLTPDFGVLTTHRGKGYLAREVSPYMSDDKYDAVDLDNLRPSFSGTLPLTHKLRCELRDEALNNLPPVKNNVDVGLITNFLTPSVEWEWPDKFSLVHVRR